MNHEELLDGLSQIIDAKWNPILNRLDIIGDSLDGIGNRLDTVEGRLDKIEDRLDMVENRLDTIENRFDTVESRLDTIENRLETVVLKQDRTIAKLGDLSLDVSVSERNIKKDVRGLNDSIETVVQVLAVNKLIS